MTLEGDAIFKEKLTGGLKNDIKNLINFHANRRKSENLYFHRVVLSKDCLSMKKNINLCILKKEGGQMLKYF